MNGTKQSSEQQDLQSGPQNQGVVNDARARFYTFNTKAGKEPALELTTEQHAERLREDIEFFRSREGNIIDYLTNNPS
jgi:hypothetical protein